jgi:uncharacterized membrane protein
MRDKTMQNQKSALGLDGNITALIGYIIGIVALVLIFIEKDNKFVRFHAFQAALFWAAAIVIYVILIFLLGFMAFFSSGLAYLLSLLIFLFGLAVVGSVIFLAIKSYQGEVIKLPVFGEMAQEWSK